MQFVPQLPNPSEELAAAGADQMIVVGDTPIATTLTLPRGASAVVALVYPTSAGRYEPLHRFVAEVLAQSGLATLEVDLLSPAEEATLLQSSSQRDFALLSARIDGILTWLANQASIGALPLGVVAFDAAAAPARAIARSDVRLGALACVPEGDELPRDREANLPTLVIPRALKPGRLAETLAEFFALELKRARQ